MPRYCPECRGEFRDEIISCPDCEVTLVAEWALERSAEEPNHDPPVTVLETGDLAALALAKSVLEEAEIPYAVWNERAIEVFPGSDSGSVLRDRHGGAQLQVPTVHEKRAREILEILKDDTRGLVAE